MALYSKYKGLTASEQAYTHFNVNDVILTTPTRDAVQLRDGKVDVSCINAKGQQVHVNDSPELDKIAIAVDNIKHSLVGLKPTVSATRTDAAPLILADADASTPTVSNLNTTTKAFCDKKTGRGK